MPVSIHYHEQSGDRLTVGRLSSQTLWSGWDPTNRQWDVLDNGVVCSHRVLLPTAPGYLESLLPACDAYYVLVAYRLEPEAVVIGVARCREPFEKGDREPPEWARPPKVRATLRPPSV